MIRDRVSTTFGATRQSSDIFNAISKILSQLLLVRDAPSPLFRSNHACAFRMAFLASCREVRIPAGRSVRRWLGGALRSGRQAQMLSVVGYRLAATSETGTQSTPYVPR